jgi:hypothetical protein
MIVKKLFEDTKPAVGGSIERMELKDLKESISNHGQLEEIIECDVVLPDGRVVNNAIVSGYKRSAIISNPRKKHIGKVGLVKYMGLLQDNTPVKMTAKDKKIYVAERARIYTSLGMSHKDIMETLKKQTGLSDRRLYMLIPDDLKDPVKQAARKSDALMHQKQKPDIPKEKTLDDFSKLDIISYLMDLLDANRMPKYVITDDEKAKLVELKNLIEKWCI